MCSVNRFSTPAACACKLYALEWHPGLQHKCSFVPAQSFDDLLLMKYGGSVMYHGHLGMSSCRLIEYFKAVPGVPDVPDVQEGFNPATWMLHISTPGMEAALRVDYAEIYMHSDLFRRGVSLRFAC